MANYTGPDCRLCRRENTKLFLKGSRCYTDKCAFERRPSIPGMHQQGRKKVSSYSTQLREKQKTKRIYGLCERQFRLYYEKASILRGASGENMLVLLERRLDNVVLRMGLATSRAHARQIVNHNLIAVNGNPINIPSYLVKAGDVVAVKENKRSKKLFEDIKAGNKKTVLPKWLTFDNTTLSGKVVELPKREDIVMPISEHMIVELYSK